MEQPVRDVKIT